MESQPAVCSSSTGNTGAVAGANGGNGRPLECDASTTIRRPRPLSTIDSPQWVKGAEACHPRRRGGWCTAPQAPPPEPISRATIRQVRFVGLVLCLTIMRKQQNRAGPSAMPPQHSVNC